LKEGFWASQGDDSVRLDTTGSIPGQSSAEISAAGRFGGNSTSGQRILGDSYKHLKAAQCPYSIEFSRFRQTFSLTESEPLFEATEGCDPKRT